MEELQDAIEDAQYVNAINTQEDGPRPVLAWETPATEEAMEEWASTKKFDLDSLLESAIAFYLFSAFIKINHHDYLRINFCEDVLRFKRLRGRSRRKQAQFMMENYFSKSKPPLTETANNTADAYKLVNGNDGPPKTEIEECDLERTVVNTKSNAYLKEDASFRIYYDYPECSQSVVGLRDAVLEDLLDDWREWEEQERKSAAQSQGYRRAESGGAVRNSGSSKPRSSSGNSLGVEDGTLSHRTEPQLTTNSKSSQRSASSGKEEVLKSGEGQTELTTATQEPASEPLMESTPSNEEGEPAGANTAKAKLSKSHSAPVVTGPVKMISGLTLTEYGDATTSMRVLTQKFKNQNKAVHDTLFDQAETVIMESLRREYWESFLTSQEFARARNFLWYQDRPVVPDDFYIMRVLGRGGFGLVNACKKGTSGKLYGMKMMNKRRIKMKKSEQLALNERMALAAVESNFVVNLKYSFHSKDDVYLILDLMTGGDLGFHLHQKGRFPKREVQYYAARIMLGLQAMHDEGYVYRDLKPENILMADDGRVKITDLGLATKITPTLHGAAGTRGYWAPEMLRRDKRGKRMPYGHTVDWFSFGCCVTEFICGANPFRSEAALNFGLAKGKQTKEKAIDCATLEMEPDFPKEFFETDARDLCTRLLEKEEKLRLGAGGCEEIMAHPYFKNVNWEAIIADRKRPPYVPAKDVNAASQSEIGNFIEDKTYQETVLTEEDEAFYKNWAWTNPRAYATEVIEFLIYERETGEPLLPIQQNAGCCCVVL